MQVDNDILLIRSDNLSDSIYDIKNALEESSICRVRKIFSACCNDDPEEHALNSKPNKKVFYIWVEWTNTNASCMFTARLTHQGAHALFKLDRRWGQPIVTERDEYGNPSEHAHWVVRRSSRFMVQEEEHYYLGDRDNEEIWQTYLAEGESEEDTDDEQEEPEAEEPLLQLESPLQIPELKHNSPVAVKTPAPKTLSLFMPSNEEELKQEPEPPATENDAFIRENFVLADPGALFKKSPDSLSAEELNDLSKGIINNNIEDFIFKKIINFPGGTIIDIKK